MTSTAIGSPITMALDSADVCGAGTRDEPLRTSAWEARLYVITKGTRFGLSSVEVRAFYLSPDNKDNLETAGSAH